MSELYKSLSHSEMGLQVSCRVFRMTIGRVERLLDLKADRGGVKEA